MIRGKNRHKCLESQRKQRGVRCFRRNENESATRWKVWHSRRSEKQIQETKSKGKKETKTGRACRGWSYNLTVSRMRSKGLKGKSGQAVRLRGIPFPRLWTSLFKKAHPLSNLLNIHEKRPFERALPSRRVAGPARPELIHLASSYEPLENLPALPSPFPLPIYLANQTKGSLRFPPWKLLRARLKGLLGFIKPSTITACLCVWSVARVPRNCRANLVSLRNRNGFSSESNCSL